MLSGVNLIQVSSTPLLSGSIKEIAEKVPSTTVKELSDRMGRAQAPP